MVICVFELYLYAPNISATKKFRINPTVDIDIGLMDLSYIAQCSLNGIEAKAEIFYNVYACVNK